MHESSRPAGAGPKAVLSLIIAVVLPGAAEARAERLVLLESHARSPEPRARRIVDVISQAVGRRVIQGKAVSKALEKLYGRPSRALDEQRLAALLEQLKVATKATYSGEWQPAIALLRAIRRELGRDVLSLSHLPHVYQALQQARLLLSMCYVRTSRQRLAWEMMEEALLAQPTMSLPTLLYGPTLQRLYYRVRTQLKLQRGTLTVKTTPPGALVFLSGRSVGFSPAVVRDVFQGTYEVMVVHQRRVSRIRRVTLGHRPTQLHIDLGLEQAVHTTPRPWLHLSAGPGRQERELRIATELGRALAARRVILVGLQQMQKRRAIVGRVVDVRRRKAQALAYVFTDPEEPTVDTLHRLARFLLHGDAPGHGVIVARRSRAPGAALPGPTDRSLTRLDATGWALLAVGLATGIGGGVALGLNGRTAIEADATHNRQVYATGRLGATLLGSGLGVAVVGAILLIVDRVYRRRNRSRHRANNRRVIVPVTGGPAYLSLGGRF